MDLYSDIILDHYTYPRHAALLKHPSVHVVEHNPLCGDSITLDIIIENHVITDVGFLGTGCAISQAAMSMVSDELMGKNIQAIKDITNEDIFSLLQVHISPARVKCALLGLCAAKHAMREYEQT